MKKCKKCGLGDDQVSFSKLGRSKDGLAYSCKGCINKENRAEYTKRLIIYGNRTLARSPSRYAGKLSLEKAWPVATTGEC